MWRLVLVLWLAAGCDYVFRLDSVDDDAGAVGDRPYSDRPSWDCELGPETMLAGNFESQTADPSERDDLLEMFYSYQGDLWTARRSSTTVPYQIGHAITPLMTSYDDYDPNLSPDGLTLYFASTRIAPTTGTMRLHMATRTSIDDEFTAPLHIDTGDAWMAGFDVSADGLRLYLTSTTDDLVVMSRPDRDAAFSAPTVYGHGVTWPSVAGDELAIYYQRDNKLYRMTRTDIGMEFGLETPLGPGLDPAISTDGRRFVYRTSTGLGYRECP